PAGCASSSCARRADPAQPLRRRVNPAHGQARPPPRDSAAMTDAAPRPHREDRLLRAMVFALAVLAQLMLPALVLRAEASAGDLCVMRAGATSPAPGKADTHGQQCTHCVLHDCAPLSPPAVATVALWPTQARADVCAFARAPAIAARRVQPPPTGPPS